MHCHICVSVSMNVMWPLMMHRDEQRQMEQIEQFARFYEGMYANMSSNLWPCLFQKLPPLPR